MGNPSAPTKDSESRKEVSSVADHEDQETEANSNPTGGHVSVEIHEEKEERRRAESETIQRRGVLYKVPPQLRENKMHIYDPVVLALGPYHDHCKSEFRQVEEFKDEVVNDYISILGADKDKAFLISKILERIGEIRNFYGGVSIDKYNDEALAEMMLRDGLFVLYFMEMTAGNREKDVHFVRRLGLSVDAFLSRDMLMLENQIPFWLIKMLITSTYDDRIDEGKALVCKFLSSMNFGDPHKLRRVPWELEEEKEPLHLLEAHRITLVQEETKVPPSANFEVTWIQRMRWTWRSLLTKYGWKESSQGSSMFEQENSAFRSVTYLKVKGIHFGQASYCLKDIKFNSYWFYGKLQLPIWYVFNDTQVFFSNVIAFEMFPETSAATDAAVLSYVNFMKSLIEKPEDVKELREKGILFSELRNDDDVMKVFKDIDTYGINNICIFKDIQKQIDKHCKSKSKTWMAELIHTKFHSPWTVIALLAAIVLLCLTFLQTYYTMHPRN